MDPDTVAKVFVEHYYTTFDSNRARLVSLYQEGSMLTFEGQKIQGSQNIAAKFTSLPFQQCKHNITTFDCQPSGPSGGVLVLSPEIFSSLANNTLSIKKREVFTTTPRIPNRYELIGTMKRTESPRISGYNKNMTIPLDEPQRDNLYKDHIGNNIRGRQIRGS
ncbi:hypothetical protein N665_1075s0009 [Sinapis alba]|nr:hypothetical protein N665_1075s0009 [Sinapis alba]